MNKTREKRISRQIKSHTKTNTTTNKNLTPLPPYPLHSPPPNTALTYPLDFVRGRISGKGVLPNSSKKYTGILQTINLTIKEEGPTALYKGVKPTLLGAVPYEGIKFGTVGFLETLFPNDTSDSNIIRKVIFGAAGGVSAGCITYPNDTIRRLLQLQGTPGAENFNGYFDCARKVRIME